MRHNDRIVLAETAQVRGAVLSSSCFIYTSIRERHR